MNVLLRNALVATSLLGFVWVGCSEDADPVDDGTDTTTTSTGTPSTGSVVSSTSASVTVTSASATTTTGGGTYDCNPVTNEPCTDGAACDLASGGTFACIAPPNDQAVCENCSQGNGPWCQGTMTCLLDDGFCRKFCCDNGDCGPSFTCQLGIVDGFPDLGICVGSLPGEGGGGAGGGGAGGGSVCGDVPATPPSNGACIPAP